MPISSAVTAAHLLVQSAEAALPKHKKNLPIIAYKQAMVALKRKYKQGREEKGNVDGSTHLLQDALLYIFGFLDMRSLVSVGLVCRVSDEEEQEVASKNCTDWKEAFKNVYEGNSSRKLALHRGFCAHCKTIVWLCNTKCPNKHHELQQVKPLSPFQVVEYILDDSFELVGSSDSDGDRDECLGSSFWVFPCHIRRCKWIIGNIK